jgi:hypothetical protein
MDWRSRFLHLVIASLTPRYLTDNESTSDDQVANTFKPKDQSSPENATTGIVRFINTFPPRTEYSGNPWLRITS